MHHYWARRRNCTNYFLPCHIRNKANVFFPRFRSRSRFFNIFSNATVLHKPPVTGVFLGRPERNRRVGSVSLFHEGQSKYLCFYMPLRLPSPSRLKVTLLVDGFFGTIAQPIEPFLTANLQYLKFSLPNCCRDMAPQIHVSTDFS